MRGFTFGQEYFGTFTRAFFTLVQVLTGESWAEAVARPVLFGFAPWNAFGGSFYFTTFLVLMQIIFLNVVVAVLLDKFVAVDPNPGDDSAWDGMASDDEEEETSAAKEAINENAQGWGVARAGGPAPARPAKKPAAPTDDAAAAAAGLFGGPIDTTAAFARGKNAAAAAPTTGTSSASVRKSKEGGGGAHAAAADGAAVTSELAALQHQVASLHAQLDDDLAVMSMQLARLGAATDFSIGATERAE